MYAIVLQSIACMIQQAVALTVLLVIRWGGRDLSALSNVVFSNGNYDPWSGGGVLESQSDTLVAVHVDQGAHHLDVSSGLALKNEQRKIWHCLPTGMQWYLTEVCLLYGSLATSCKFGGQLFHYSFCMFQGQHLGDSCMIRIGRLGVPTFNHFQI